VIDSPVAVGDKHVLITGAGYNGSLLTGVLLQRGYHIMVVDDLIFGGKSLLAYCPHPHFRFLKESSATAAAQVIIGRVLCGAVTRQAPMAAPEKWDGRAAARIVDVVETWACGRSPSHK
jgi:nucleoside-diphosphate-sugar epimerase